MRVSAMAFAHRRARECASILVILCASSAAAPAQERWTTYVNERFGTTADYPAHLFTQRMRPPDNGDGQEFRSADGRARLVIHGGYNIDDDTPQSYVEKLGLAEGATFRRITDRFYVLSGTKGAEIFYTRCNFRGAPDDVIDCFNLTYPSRDKAAWDRVVTRIGQSLRAGRGVGTR